MTLPSEPTPTQAPPATYWQVPSPRATDDPILPWFRARFVGLAAALLIQATIAVLGVLPELPLRSAPSDMSYYNGPAATFWIQFAVMGFIAAVVVALGFRPGVRLGDLPVIAQLVLGLGFIVLPAAAIVLGGLDVAEAAANVGPSAVASTWLSTATFGILFFGLPVLTLVASAGRPTVEPTGQRPA